MRIIRHANEAGFTLIEMIVVLSLSVILVGFASINLHDLADSSEGAAAALSGFFKMSRSKAISTTSAYFIQPQSTNQVITLVGTNCSDASPVADPSMTLDLPDHVHMTSVGWEVCFNSRGLSDSSASITLEDNFGEEFEVQVFMGGAVRVQ